jgi:hypothetical protein
MKSTIKLKRSPALTHRAYPSYNKTKKDKMYSAWGRGLGQVE